VVFMVSDGQRATVSAMDLRTRRRVDSLAAGHGPHYLSSGHLAFADRNGQLSLLPFDPSNLRALGPAVPLQEPVAIGATGEFQGAVASNGTVAFVPRLSTLRSFAKIDRDGKERPLAIEPKPLGYFWVSPDGQSIVSSFDSDVWVFNFGSNVWSRLTTDRQSGGGAAWTPDGRDLVFESRRDGVSRVYRQPASPLTTATLFLSVPGTSAVFPRSWLPGSGLVLNVSPREHGRRALRGQRRNAAAAGRDEWQRVGGRRLGEWPLGRIRIG
jgi:WD40 repeat protein